jgi:hypothetical protein
MGEVALSSGARPFPSPVQAVVSELFVVEAEQRMRFAERAVDFQCVNR